MRVVTGRAVTQCARMLNFRLFHLLGLLGMACHAERPAIGVGQDDLAVFGSLVAAVAHLVFERIVQEGLHQFRSCRLVRVVTLNAIRATEWLPIVRLDQAFVFAVVAIQAEGRWRLGQMFVEFNLSALTCLMRDVTGLASHVEGRVTASVFWDIHSLVVTSQAKVVVFTRSAGRLQQ